MQTLYYKLKSKLKLLEFFKVFYFSIGALYYLNVMISQVMEAKALRVSSSWKAMLCVIVHLTSVYIDAFTFNGSVAPDSIIVIG